MKGINILNMTAGMAAVLLSVTLFSCSSDVPYENTDKAQQTISASVFLILATAHAPQPQTKR